MKLTDGCTGKRVTILAAGRNSFEAGVLKGRDRLSLITVYYSNL